MRGASIRRARPEDVGFLGWAVVAAARSHLPRGFWDLFVPESDDERNAFVGALLLAEKPSWWHWSRFWIAERDGRPAAALSGFDATHVESPNTAVPTAATAVGFDASRLVAASQRCAPMFECFHEPVPGAWIVESVATRPEARGAGLAATLVEHVLAEGRDAGHELALLSLMIGNTAAQHVYERAGFAITAEKRSARFQAALGCPGVALMSCRLGA